MQKIFLILLLSLSLSAKTTTPNDVYALSVLIQEHVHFLLKYYKIEHKHEEILARDKIIYTKLKPRNIWQKSYELLVKINLLRENHDLARIKPVGIEAMKNLNPAMVYEMNQRILTELEIFEVRKKIQVPVFKIKIFSNKTPLDNYNMYADLSGSFDELNKRALTPDYVYAEVMRIYDEITTILNYLNIEDTTLPDKRVPTSTPKDNMNISMEILQVIKKLQISVGIESTDLSEFNKKEISPSDMFSATGLIISELQPIKAHIGLGKNITPAAKSYSGKKPENVGQLMQWNLKRMRLIKDLYKATK